MANTNFLTPFQHLFADFCVLMAKICILLFFLESASKPPRLLITSAGLIFRKFKPNHAKKHFLWRYSDTKITFVPEPFLRYYKPLPTERAVTSRR